MTPEGLLHPNRPILVTGRSRASVQRITEARGEGGDGRQTGENTGMRRKVKKRDGRGLSLYTGIILPPGFGSRHSATRVLVYGDPSR